MESAQDKSRLLRQQLFDRLASEIDGLLINGPELAGEHQGGFTGAFDVEIIVREKDAKLAAEFIETHFPEA